MMRNAETPAAPRWWQYLVCPLILIWGATAWIGSFIFFNPYYLLLMLLFAVFGTVLSVWLLVRDILRSRRNQAVEIPAVESPREQAARLKLRNVANFTVTAGSITVIGLILAGHWIEHWSLTVLAVPATLLFVAGAALYDKSQRLDKERGRVRLE